MSRYTIVESTSRGVENVNRYEDLERHHPSDPELPSREYDTIGGRREEVKLRDREEIVKDFVLLQNGSDRNVSVPSPFPTSYAHPTHDGTNTVFFYDKPFGTPGAQRLGAVLHMEPGSEPREGQRIEYGKPIGIQSDYGAEPGAIHVHLQADLATQQKYISDVAEGRIQSGGVVTATPPTGSGNSSPDSGTVTDKLLEKGEDGPGVKRLQEALNAAGIQVEGKPLPTTGHYGDMTEQAVKQYQQQKGLEVDGRAGKDTLTALGIYPGQEQSTTQPAPTQPPQAPTQQAPTPETPTPQTPAQPAPAQQTNPYGFGQANELGTLIGSGEGGYNSYNRGSAGDAGGAQIDFSQMTVGEVMRRQALSGSNPESLFAVGKYQFTTDTLKETVDALGIDRNAKFTPQLQEKMFADYLIDEKRPDVKAYITGKSGGPEGLERAQSALALEFASVGDPQKGGRGAYDDDPAGNKASITPSEVATALNHMREQYQKNIQGGQTPDQAYRALSGDPNAYTQSSGATSQTRGQGGGVDDTLLVKEESGDGVKRLQEALNKAGIRDEQGQPLPVTGYFGDKTEAAVSKYQEQKGLEVDGKAGKDTLTALGIYPGQQAPANAPPTTTEPPQAPSNAAQTPPQTPPTTSEAPPTQPTQPTTAPANAQPNPANPTPTDKPQTPPTTSEAPSTQPTQPTTPPANAQPNPANPANPANPTPTDKPQTANDQVQPPTQNDKPLISNPNHPDNKLYQQAVSNLEQLGPSGGFKSREDLEKAAASMAADAKATGLQNIDHISKTSGSNGQAYLVAVQGDPTNPASKNAYVDYNQATSQTVAQSTAMVEAQKPATQPAQTPTQQQTEQPEPNRLTANAR